MVLRPWPSEFPSHIRESGQSSSASFEIYPIVIAALSWGHEWSSRSILVYSDNLAAVGIINKGRSNSIAVSCGSPSFSSLYVPGHSNAIADSLSRVAFQIFRTSAPDADPSSTPVPPFPATTFIMRVRP